ncbi:GPI11 (YDR302W) [Zygosaccharomyces parabailii]|uniref:Glycosylphosphatidylinositol anchor biosynthesis protein 11 n=1 Tax=Zygosaccharomyces bailii (strain CLIB 213 / ATCC 58445 / CBS 680 / BCRC 21525 / NBRC 1098 / NCYC 1416 / NRRL Y-2227) TaxID=1333698 RepID=A0A8J2T3Q7_ZYGB2|nr:GPI11 (YDR302W) [Zygosaccharomyces parabailii]CDF87924.1 BN860_17568g1_1 [Zygosaccharomyces bailii CLIB 213]CDH17980.1 probable Glycosylphosphatidylinositol anchor biosynthesis protein 11 [Zygosaccharomyces bailii ISA1307]
MGFKNKRGSVKKSVSFSDDNTLTRNTLKRHIDHDNPPVYVRTTTLTVPWHLFLLLYYYIYVSTNYDTVRMLYLLIPLQIFYLVFQFNKSTVYGKKLLKINIPLVLVSLSASALLTLPTMIIIILFGAPMTDKLIETWLLSLHLCFLAYPAVYQVFNGDFKVGLWKKYFIMIVVGAWTSCIVIPLDWDRYWQTWPIPVVVGGYLGALIGYSIGAFI